MTETKYKRIARELAERIESGDFQPGDQLPSQKAVSARYGVTQVTVSRAFGVLENAGMITRIQGKGTFVGNTETLMREHLPVPVYLTELEIDALQSVVSNFTQDEEDLESALPDPRKQKALLSAEEKLAEAATRKG